MVWLPKGMAATPTAVVVLALFAPPSGGPVATSAGLPLAWGAAGNALARCVPGGAGRAGRPQARAPAGAGGQRVGGRGQVGRREKWLYFSYTSISLSSATSPPPLFTLAMPSSLTRYAHRWNACATRVLCATSAFSYFEADECGALNHWLTLAPQAIADQGSVALGTHRLQVLET